MMFKKLIICFSLIFFLVNTSFAEEGEPTGDAASALNVINQVEKNLPVNLTGTKSGSQGEDGEELSPSVEEDDSRIKNPKPITIENTYTFPKPKEEILRQLSTEGTSTFMTSLAKTSQFLYTTAFYMTDSAVGAAAVDSLNNISRLEEWSDRSLNNMYSHLSKKNSPDARLLESALSECAGPSSSETIARCMGDEVPTSPGGEEYEQGKAENITDKSPMMDKIHDCNGSIPGSEGELSLAKFAGCSASGNVLTEGAAARFTADLLASAGDMVIKKVGKGGPENELKLEFSHVKGTKYQNFRDLEIEIAKTRWDQITELLHTLCTYSLGENKTPWNLVQHETDYYDFLRDQSDKFRALSTPSFPFTSKIGKDLIALYQARYEDCGPLKDAKGQYLAYFDKAAPPALDPNLLSLFKLFNKFAEGPAKNQAMSGMLEIYANIQEALKPYPEEGQLVKKPLVDMLVTYTGEKDATSMMAEAMKDSLLLHKAYDEVLLEIKEYEDTGEVNLDNVS